MARLRPASSTRTKCHSWRLEPVGAWTAACRHSTSTSRGTGRSKSSPLRTAPGRVRTSWAVSPRESLVTAGLLQAVAQRIVPLELLQREWPLGPLRVLGGVDRLQQQVDVLRCQADPLLAALVDDLGDRVSHLGRRLGLDDVRPRGRPEQLLGAGESDALELAHDGSTASLIGVGGFKGGRGAFINARAPTRACCSPPPLPG